MVVLLILKWLAVGLYENAKQQALTHIHALSYGWPEAYSYVSKSETTERTATDCLIHHPIIESLVNYLCLDWKREEGHSDRVLVKLASRATYEVYTPAFKIEISKH